ncbi:DUF1566 domain-containing protein [Legionella sp.]|uniref:DUF1566 domain-containing protein n=1 Tax=Legionella sp. TaxID=459 RepID=UPI003C9CABC1
MQRKKRHYFRNTILTAFFSCLMLSGVQAARPLWTFVPQTPTDITTAKGSSAQVIYTIQNQSSRAKTLVMKPIAGISQSTSCQLPAKGICTLTLNVNGSALQGDIVGGPVLCQQGNALQCYQPSPANILRIRLAQQPPTTLSPLTQNLALSINNPGADPALVGNARIIRIENTGSIQANNLQVSTSGFPAGTLISNNGCTGTLNAGVTCDITITPGGTASPDNSSNACTTSPGTEPVPTIVTVSADDAPSTDINVLVLGYGCIYQGGFLFSVDDATLNTGSIGGKVAALSDEERNPGVFTFQWATVSNITGADSITDGLSNTNALANPAGQYPGAQACLAKSDQGFIDWFMPAICELGRFVGAGGSDAGCGTTNPNLYTTLYINNLGAFTNDNYWSSTEFSSNPMVDAWLQSFINGIQNGVTKVFDVRVRCVRAFTP